MDLFFSLLHCGGKMLDKIKLNVVRIYKQAICMCGSLFSLVAIVTSFVTWDELGIEKQKRLSILGFIILFAFAFSAIHILLFKKKYHMEKRKW